MQPAGKGALKSLYSHDPTFAARRVAELDGQRDCHPVAIGPALVLAQYGIGSILLDRKEMFNDGSRAVCVARPSMQILQRIGAVEPLPSKALSRWRNA